MTKFLKLSFILVSSMLATLAMAQNTISIQSTLKNISGEAVADGMQSITFKFYTVLENGSAVWEEIADVEVVSGIYSHELGSITPLVPTDFGNQLWLGVTINGKELAPRTKLGFAPYAMAVSALAASGEAASFDGNGKFIVSKDMFVTTDLTVGGVLSTSSISNTDTITSTGHISGNTAYLSGRVGIGTDAPVTTLHVKAIGTEGSGTASFPTDYFRAFVPFFEHLAVTDPPGGSVPFLANFEGQILATAMMTSVLTTWSDQRIKTNLHQSNNKLDLALLNKIEITEYDYIDKIKNDTRRQKKVIAQQVADVLPNAVNKARGVIPNVYEVAKEFDYNAGILRVQTAKAHDFVIGDKIDLKTPKNDLDNVEVLSVIDDHTFTVHAEEKPENVFVYGKYVDDCLSVDYDAIAMLNVSASQEMYRMIIDLQKANEDLIKVNKALKSSVTNMDDRLSMLESLIVKSENKTINNTETAGK